MNVGKEIRSLRVITKSKRFVTLARVVFLAAVLGNIVLLPLNVAPSLALAAASQPVDVWWPTEGSHVTGTQPFKAMVDGLDVSSYDMSWSVDGGAQNAMQDNSTDYLHKEAQVDLSGWTWHGSGPYTLTFTAQKGGATIAQSDVTIYVDNGLPVQPAAPAGAVAPAPSVTADTSSSPAPSSSAVTSSQPASLLLVQDASDPSKQATFDISGWGLNAGSNLLVTLKDAGGGVVSSAQAPVAGVSVAAPTTVPVAQSVAASGLYVDPHSDAATQATLWQQSRPSDAAKMNVLASAPTAKWFGGWSGDIQAATAQYVGDAAAAGKIPMLVAYNIPARDCGGYSSGGATTKDDYLNWIGGMSRGIGNKSALIVLEPDALAGLDCLSGSEQAARTDLLSSAVSILKSNSNTKVYLDAGNATWQSAATIALRLQKAGLANADGFSLNVSNFDTTASEVAYGSQVSSQTAGKHFVIDTSRNGNGATSEWCNPSGRAIGNTPTTQTGNSLVDAYLWIKTPGESDGTCNGGPSAGTWWPQYALGLVP